jgi:chromosome segregation ATPase
VDRRMDWLREHMVDHLTNSDLIERRDRVVNFTMAPVAAKSEGETVLDLVNQAADVLMSIEAQAAAVEVRARNLAREAGEKLQLAESRIQSLEAARHMAEQGMHAANARAQEAEKELKDAQSRAAAAEAELFAMERRVKLAEERAESTRDTLNRVEAAIKTKLLDLRRTASHNRPVAA